ncbi:MAG: DUF523 and DUF1722 domain-containing protein [Candidatus Zixiibacteriota bacterium]
MANKQTTWTTVSKRSPQNSTIKIGVSSCLLGHAVRFDGGDKRNSYITDTLRSCVEFVAVCPEVEMGLPVPREPVRLEGTPDEPRMVSVFSGTDWTVQMNRYARGRVRCDDIADLSGFILKSRSPSCGLERVKLYRARNRIREDGVGLFARALTERFPHLPVVEEHELAYPARRDRFLIRAAVYHRLQQLYRKRFSRREMLRFHSEHRHLVLEQSRARCRQLDRLSASIESMSASEFRDRYLALFMEGLA